ncbi:MAG: rhodanese-like domain-containing protein [Halobacteriota archaeon]
MPANDKVIEYVTPEELARKLDCDECTFLLDVRSPEELHGELGHLPRATNIPLSQLRDRLSELAGNEDLEIVVICRTGKRSEGAAQILHDVGFKRISVLKGGMIAWREDPTTQGV